MKPAFRALLPGLLFICCLSILSCNRQSGPARPTEQYLPMTSPAPSRLQLPIHISRLALQQLIDAQLPQVIIQDKNFSGYGFEMEVLRAGQPQVSFKVPDNPPPTKAQSSASAKTPNTADAQPKLIYQIPLRVLIRKNALITTLKLEGELVMEFASGLGLKPDWTFYSKTEVTGHRWIKKPELGVGGLSIPIEKLTSALLQRGKTSIGQEIDATIAQNVAFDQTLLGTLQSLAEPQVASEEYGGYLLANPTGLGLGPLQSKDGGISTVLQLDFKPAFVLGEAPKPAKITKLPPNTGVQDFFPRFAISIQGLMAYDAMKQVLAKALVDTTLSQSGRSATIKEVELFGQDSKLVVGLRMTGDYNGWAWYKARPVFDADNESLDLVDTEVILDTRNFFYRSIGFLFRNRIQNAISAQVGEQVGAQIETIRQTIDAQLKDQAVVPGIKLRGKADRLSIQQTYLSPQGLHARLVLEGQMSVFVEEIPLE